MSGGFEGCHCSPPAVTLEVGCIEVGGNRLCDLNLTWWRQNIGMVSQAEIPHGLTVVFLAAVRGSGFRRGTGKIAGGSGCFFF